MRRLWLSLAVSTRVVEAGDWCEAVVGGREKMVSGDDEWRKSTAVGERDGDGRRAGCGSEGDSLSCSSVSTRNRMAGWWSVGVGEDDDGHDGVRSPPSWRDDGDGRRKKMADDGVYAVVMVSRLQVAGARKVEDDDVCM
ncbi:hypothetical protein Dimus_015147 [Dionaea muscipula]